MLGRVDRAQIALEALLRTPGCVSRNCNDGAFDDPESPNYLSLVDAILGQLRKVGAGEQEAAWGVDLLLLYLTGQAVEKSTWDARADSAGNSARLASAIEAADVRLHPNVARLGAKLTSGTFERFDWHLDFILNRFTGTPARKRRKAHGQ
jgi:Tetracyclin repressor-like, C-terminal domain